MTEGFKTIMLPVERNKVAPDGSDVRVLLQMSGGGMAHFELPVNGVSRAIAHRTVDEIWFILRGSGQMWRRQGESAESVPLAPGVCLTIPVGTHFQFRSSGECPLEAIGVTMPPWPGDEEAYEVVGVWPPDPLSGP